MGYLNTEAIERVVRDGAAFCGTTAKLGKLRPGARMVLKPDALMADSQIARYAYTHPDVLRSTLSYLLTSVPGARVKVIGSAVPEISTARVFRRANGLSETYRMRGYYELENIFPGQVELCPDEEADHWRYRLSKGQVRSGGLGRDWNDRVANEISAPRDYYEADFAIYCPKIKSSVRAQGFSGAVRLGDLIYRGSAQDAHIADMLEVCNPGLIVSDGIIAAVGGNEVTQRGHELGVVLVANNALAHDLVAAQILGLDPFRIDHLKAAATRGWGPNALNHIEIGGAGLDGVQQLAQKTKFWDLGALTLSDFPPKFERENPGLQFPLEIISPVNSDEQTCAHDLFLDWLYLTYDFPARRQQIARWPKASICIGDFTGFPSNYLIYAVGHHAYQALARMTSSATRLVKLGGLEARVLQLKNGSRHFAISIAFEAKRPPRLRDLIFGFWVGSLGRMTARAFTLALSVDRVSTRMRIWAKAPKDTMTARVVMTSRMQQNAWWALKPVRPCSLHPATGAEVETEAFGP